MVLLFIMLSSPSSPRQLLSPSPAVPSSALTAVYLSLDLSKDKSSTHGIRHLNARCHRLVSKAILQIAVSRTLIGSSGSICNPVGEFCVLDSFEHVLTFSNASAGLSHCFQRLTHPYALSTHALGFRRCSTGLNAVLHPQWLYPPFDASVRLPRLPISSHLAAPAPSTCPHRPGCFSAAQYVWSIRLCSTPSAWGYGLIHMCSRTTDVHANARIAVIDIWLNNHGNKLIKLVWGVRGLDFPAYITVCLS